MTISEEFFVIPLNAVLECVDLTDEDRKHTHGRNLARVRGEIIPYIPLRDAFSINGCKPSTEQIVVTEIGEKRVGFVVDKVVGQHQTVIKNLGKLLKPIEGISGATIMGDGSLALILDINKLTHQAEIAEHDLVA